MTRRYLIPVLLLLLAVTIPIYSQSSVGYQSNESNGQPSDSLNDTSSNCTDQQLATNGACPLDQSTVPALNPAQPTGMSSNQVSGRTPYSPSENGTLLGQGNPLQQIQGRSVQLPPDQPTEFQKFVAATTGQFLPIYGVSLFHNVPSTFAPIDLAPVTSDYVIGPEDQLRVRIWGQINYSGNLRVDRSGDIYLPQVGAVHVAGLPFSALDLHMREAVAKMFRNFDLSVDIGQIRSMQVYVTGQARRPGVYTVSSLSTLVDTLFASGGPSPQGSLRHILVNREGKTVADFDLYGLLIRGDKSHDIRLLPEDVIYIPSAGHQVAITGSIRTPAIYEMRDGETIADVIAAAGKTTALSSSARISLERIGPDQLRQAMEFPLDASGLATPLADGDVLRVYSILPAFQKTITLRGNVANPGHFGFKPGMHLSDLIPDKDSLVSRDYWWKRSQLGLPAPEFQPLITNIGQVPLTTQVTRAGFTTAVTQQNLTSALTAKKPVSALASIQQQELANSLQTPDQATGQGQGQGQLQNGSNGSIASSNSDNSPTSTLMTEKKTDVHLLSPQIDWDFAEIERIDPNTLKTSLIPFDLGKLVINHDASQDLELQPGDTITIFSQSDLHVPIDHQTKYVDIEGEVVHAGFYSVQPGETLRDVVRRAGGFTSNAYLYGSEFDRESTRVLQQQRLDEYVRSLTLETQRGTQALAISGTASSGASNATAAQAVGQDIIARLSQIRATGRIVFEVSPGKSSINDVPNITLENGDKFEVPNIPATINVVGAVYNQNSFLFESGRTVEHYLKLAGGTNRNADWRHAFIIRADGSVVSKTSVKNYGAWTKSFTQLRLNPGDSIVVPDKTLRPTALKNFLDWTQVFSQLALGAAAINVL